MTRTHSPHTLQALTQSRNVTDALWDLLYLYNINTEVGGPLDPTAFRARMAALDRTFTLAAGQQDCHDLIPNMPAASGARLGEPTIRLPSRECHALCKVGHWLNQRSMKPEGVCLGFH